MKFDRIWAMPNKWTFTIKPIVELIGQEMNGGLWCDPFCGANSPAQVRNDMDKTVEAEYHMDAYEFLRLHPDESFDGVFFDPPYSSRQISEHYKAVGRKVSSLMTSARFQSQVKDELARILKPGGKAICFGWNSMGLGIGRGFTMERVLLVPHGGSKNDTIVTVEVKDPTPSHNPRISTGNHSALDFFGQTHESGHEQTKTPQGGS